MMQHLDILTTRIVGNGHRAQRCARMNPPGRDAKYITIAEPLTDAQLRDHLAGRSTYAAYIIGADGLVSAACVELDQDAIEGARRVLEAAKKYQIDMFAIAVKGAGQHDGSHCWALFAERVKPADAAHLMRQIAIAAGYPDAEIWPREQAIRIPFGIHTHSQQRGRLILQSGETYDLDQPDQLSMGLAAVGALPLNATPAPAPIVERQARTVAPSGNARQGESVVDAFNRRYTAEQAIELCGGAKTRDAWTCNEPSHNHSNTNNLLITDRGLILAYGPNCYAPQRGTGQHALTPFGYFCEALHGGDTKAAVKAAAQLLGIQRASQRPASYTAEQATAYNANRKARRHAETREHLDRLAEHLAAIELSDRGRALALHLIGLAHDAGVLQIRPTNDELHTDLDCSPRTIQYAFRELEAARLGTRSGGRGGLDRPNERAAWSFKPHLPPLGCNDASADLALSDAVCALVYIHEDPSTESDLACERGGASVEPAPAWACWEACEPEHGADELSALEVDTSFTFSGISETDTAHQKTAEPGNSASVCTAEPLAGCRKDVTFSTIGETAEPHQDAAPVVEPASVCDTPGRVGRSGPRWYAERDGAWSWWASEQEAQIAAGLVEPCNKNATFSTIGETDEPRQDAPNQSATAGICSIAAGLRSDQPGGPNLVKLGIDDQPGASYSPPAVEPSGRSTYDRGVKPRDAYIKDGHAWRDLMTGMRRIDMPASADQQLLDLPEQTPRSPARIADPQQRSAYYALIGKAKKTASPAQAKVLRDQAARILNGAEMLAPGESAPARSGGTAPDCPPLTSPPAVGRLSGQIGLWGAL